MSVKDQIISAQLGFWERRQSVLQTQSFVTKAGQVIIVMLETSRATMILSMFQLNMRQ